LIDEGAMPGREADKDGVVDITAYVFIFADKYGKIKK